MLFKNIQGELELDRGVNDIFIFINLKYDLDVDTQISIKAARMLYKALKSGKNRRVKTLLNDHVSVARFRDNTMFCVGDEIAIFVPSEWLLEAFKQLLV